MVKGNLKSRLDGNALDLSLMSLDDVPVKEIAELHKATVIDLSSNKIKAISPALCQLTNIVKLDLSKNWITSLPNNFGDLTRLQYLDISNNRISTLPVSFYQLKSLKWLDLKDNPLNEHLKLVVGDCLDQKQCLNCAKQVVQFMDGVNDQLVQKENERIENEKAAAAKQKAKDKMKAQKETKKISPQVVHRAKAVKDNNNITSKPVPSKASNNGAAKSNGQPAKKNKAKQTSSKAVPGCQVGFSLLHKFFILLVVLASLFVGALYIYTGSEFTQAKIQVALSLMQRDVTNAANRAWPAVLNAVHWFQVDALPFLKFAAQEISSFLFDVWEIFTLVLNHSIEYVTSLIK